MATDEPSAKRKKSNADNHPNDINVGARAVLKDLGSFRLVRVLSRNSLNKTIILHGQSLETDEDAVIKMQKTAFPDNDAARLLTDETKLKNTFQNDIYGQYSGHLPPSLSSINTMIVYPATDKHICKYEDQDTFLVSESPEDYKSITLPWINSIDQFSVQWVFNILDHKAESDRIIFEDSDPMLGFILLPDLKWNGKNMEELYLSAIVHRRDIKSLRDLRASHVPLLKNIMNKGMDAIENKYGISKKELRVYVHYQPSYYHLHVHFNAIKFGQPGCAVERAHLMQDIIDNLENISSDYYEKRTLHYTLKAKDTLLKLFLEAGKA